MSIKIPKNEVLEFPKRFKIIIIAILVIFMLIAWALMQLASKQPVNLEVFLNDDFVHGGIIALIFCATIVFNPFSRKCWI